MEFEAAENLVIDDPFVEANPTSQMTNSNIPESNQFDLIKKVNIFNNYLSYLFTSNFTFSRDFF